MSRFFKRLTPIWRGGLFRRRVNSGIRTYSLDFSDANNSMYLGQLGGG